MAIDHMITVYSQPSLYREEERTLNIYFSEPDAGVNSDTGILLISAGYGGNANSKVFQKMRNSFADLYNYVTVQCDYFGWEFMQTLKPEDVYLSHEMLKDEVSEEEEQLIWSDFGKYKHLLEGKTLYETVQLDETPGNLNDMGPVQAMDLIIAMRVVADILEQNEYTINKARIHAYGFSHGAYLSLLCNAFMPGLFTGIIDNSAYLLPMYLHGIRYAVMGVSDIFTLKYGYDYLIRRIVSDEEIYNLSYLYRNRKTKANVLSFYGSDDHMTELKEKQKFMESIPNGRLVVCTEDSVDGEIIRSTKHGLGADFIKLFRFCSDNYPFEETREGLNFSEQHLETSTNRYDIIEENGTYRLLVSAKG